MMESVQVLHVQIEVQVNPVTVIGVYLLRALNLLIGVYDHEILIQITHLHSLYLKNKLTQTVFSS